MYLTDDLAALIESVTGQKPVGVYARGAGGGGKTGGSSSSTAPDTLFSTATIRLVDLVAEGEIVGVRGGLKGVYLNDIPVQNADGSFNFKGLTAEFRNGTADQSYMAGYPDVQTPKNVGVKVQQQTPVVASISEVEATRVRVTLQFPSLFLAKNDGSVANNTVQYRVEAKYSGGPWVNQIGDQTLTGKTTSGYFRSHDLTLPLNGSGASAPWQVRVTRISPDTEDFNNRQNKYTNQSDVIFYSTTSITDAKFSYSNSAVVGLTAAASLFGSSVPGRSYLVDGVLMAVPSNYDPVARTYSGIWDGTFKQAFSNNPAWALNLILSSDRFGLGDVIDSSAIDKWSLYEIGRYCDVSVPDGRGGTEPRFVFNGVISTQQEAFELLQLIAQVFQGFNYWSSGTVTATQDRPADPVLLVTEANVIDGEISYASSGRRARHTVAIVAWNDPSNLYKTEYEVVEDRDGLARYGYNPKRIDVLGCTSRGQAHRAGLWALFTELHQTQIVTYKAGLDHAVARPGDVIAVQDPQIANIDVSGRLLANSTASSLVLDRPVTLVSGSSYTVSVVLADGTVGTTTVSSGTAGTVSVLPLSPALASAPDPAAVWLLAGPVKPQQFRVITIREDEPHVYAVTAIQHEPGKYATIDTGASFEEQTYSTFPTTLKPPANVSFREGQYTDLGQPKQSLTVSWTAGEALTSTGYYVTAVRPSGAIINLPKSASTTVDFADVEIGTWTFFITAFGLNGMTSTATQASYTVQGWAAQSPTTVTNLQVLGGGSTFGGRSCTLTWLNAIAANTSPYPVRNAVYVYDISTNALLHKELLATGQTQWTYDYQVNVNEGGPRRQFRVAVTALSATGAEGPPTSLAVNNPAPAKITPTLQATSETVFVTLPKVTDVDFSGYLVWVSTTSGFTPTDANVTADDSSTFQTYKGANNTTYYVRAAAYDAFSKAAAGLNISDEFSVTCSATAFDTTAPAVPTGLSVAGNTVDVGPDGTITTKLLLNWTAVTSSNLGKYEVAFATGNNPADSAYIGGNFVSSNTITKQGFVPGQTYSVKVRSISQNGFGISAWSAVTVFTAALNTVAPDPVTNLAVSASFQNAFLTWTNPTNSDLGLIEIWAGSDNVLANATKIASVSAPGTTFTDNTLGTVATRYYWARSVNTSKVSAVSYAGPVMATSAAITGAQIAAGTISATNFASGIQPVAVVASLPSPGGYAGPSTVFNQADGKVYRYFGGAFTRATDGADIVANSITAGQIAAGAINAAQIAAGAITTSKLAITSQNLIYNGDASQGLFGFTYYPAASVTGTTALDNVAPTGFRRVKFTTTSTVPGNSVTTLDASKIDSTGSLSYYPVVAGSYYEFSACFSGTYPSNYVSMVWLNASGQQISVSIGSVVPSYTATGGAPDTYNRSILIAQAPTGAASVALRCNFANTASLASGTIGGASAFMFGTARSTQTEASPYVDWQVTAINGGNVVTGSLNASAITAGTITTDRMSAGSINADRLVANSITTGLLATDVLTANNVKIGNGTLVSLFAGTNTTTIDGGAISANSITANRIRIGSRGISTIGIEFQMGRDINGDTTNVLTWTAGRVLYTSNDGSIVNSGVIPAGSFTTAGGYAYAWWDVTNPAVIQAGNNNETAIRSNPNAVLLASVADSVSLAVFYGGTVIDGSKITTQSIDAAQIRANAITADKISAAAITAGKIATDAVAAVNIQALAVTAAKVAANAITAGAIAAGAVTANSLAVGTSTNQIQNSDFLGYPAGVSPPGWPAGWAINSVGVGWQPQGMQTLQYSIGGSPAAGNSYDAVIPYFSNGTAGNRPCIPGAYYEFSAYVSIHRTQAEIYIAWQNSNGDTVAYSESGYIGPDAAPSTRPMRDWPRCKIIGQAPSSAVSCYLVLRMKTTGDSNPYTFWTGLFFAPCTYGQFVSQVYSDWSNSGQTVIDGGNVRTGSITADRMNVGSLSAITGNVGTLTAGILQSADSKTVFNLTNGNLTISD